MRNLGYVSTSCLSWAFGQAPRLSKKVGARARQQTTETCAWTIGPSLAAIILGHQSGRHFFPKQVLEKEVARGRVSRRRNLVPGWSSFEIMRLQAVSRLSRKIIGPTVWQSLGPWRIEKHTIKKSTVFIQPWCRGRSIRTLVKIC